MTNNAIKSERTRMGLSQKELADLVGKGRATVARWESDPFSVDGDKLCKLSDIFGCSIDYLLGRTDERVPSGRVQQ